MRSCMPSTAEMSEILVYKVPGMHCGHCVRAVEAEVSALPGVDSVEADLETKVVTVRGTAGDDEIRAAIDEAGYEAE
jgi:copper chaperone